MTEPGSEREKARSDALIALREFRARIEVNERGDPVSLDLLDSPVVDAQLEYLKPLTSLESVYLNGLTRITDAGLKHLLGLTKLRELDLSGSAVSPKRRTITDTGLEFLRDLRNIEKLNLDRTEVTDEGLRHLTSFTCLRTLGLKETHVTRAGVDRLKQVLPDCEIIL
ncbi:MAG: hypothetical protein ACKVHE_31670 [Planctomycetales bacterium]